MAWKKSRKKRRKKRNGTKQGIGCTILIFTYQTKRRRFVSFSPYKKKIHTPCTTQTHGDGLKMELTYLSMNRHVRSVQF